ncbi:MAG: LytTR family DNA-binding domain-containing protein [Lachnospiraceae bacterium]
MRTRTEDRDSCLVLKSSVGVHKVHMSEIIYIEALNRKIIYYLRNNSQITCVEKFASVCDQLLQHPEFLLAHRSFLVNMNYIRTTSRPISGKRQVPSANSQAQEIKRLYLAFQMEESI